MSVATELSNLDIDEHVDDEIKIYLAVDNPRSFFLFAGAGSGKTRSLVEALKFIRGKYSQRLTFHGHSVGVITYTKAARDEIIRRLDSHPLFCVSTIHSFAWELVKGFNHDIGQWLRARLTREIEELQAAEAKGRQGTKASIDRRAQIQSKNKRLDALSSIKIFIYSPDGLNRERNALNHAEVIAIASNFLLTKPLMQSILVGRFPILLVDESQDTNRQLVDALFATATNHEGRFCLGLFGDVMQRIYNDGKDKIERELPASWATPNKKLNHRCPRRIVALINKIRAEVDSHDQVARSDAVEGYVRLFIRSASADRKAAEEAIRQKMVATTGDEEWLKQDNCKTLTLEHHMAATRLGFNDLLEPLLAIDSWRTSVIDGSLPAVRFFTRIILPLVMAARSGDRFEVAKIVRTQSPILSVEALKASDPLVLMQNAHDAVKTLTDLWNTGEPTCRDILTVVAQRGLFEVPDSLAAAIAFPNSDHLQNDDGNDPATEETAALVKFLDAPFAQIPLYANYVAGLAPFDTHQGVKGLEFNRVMVIMDDTEARGFMFGYDKLFGAKPPSTTDVRNVAEGKETGLDRTRRLFYVTCSRAKQSLALVAYTDSPKEVKARVLANGWFSEKEIDDHG